MSVLKIDASARLTDSNSRTLTQYLAKRLSEIEKVGTIIERDLAKQPFPLISNEDLIDLHASSNKPRVSLQQHLLISSKLIEELMTADTLIFGAPIYNFTIPTALKQWVDYVCRAGITFKYGENGPIGLSNVNRAFIVTASGGVPVGSDMDYASGYLEQICQFIGVDEVIHIDASGSKGKPEQIIAEGKLQIDKVLFAPPKQIAAGVA